MESSEPLALLHAASAHTLAELAALCERAAGLLSSRVSSRTAIFAATRLSTLQPGEISYRVIERSVTPVYAELAAEHRTAISAAALPPPDPAWRDRAERIYALRTAIAQHVSFLDLAIASLGTTASSRRAFAPAYHLALVLRADHRAADDLLAAVACEELRGFDPLAPSLAHRLTESPLAPLLERLLSDLTGPSVLDALLAARASWTVPAPRAPFLP